eukprot:Phypoly_transcript_11905.p1 GENE.Phypoly_transcript_11905~~Phypoly_transcript_11905.p1  ORF type:complete len:320 (+),score=42.29 Phypoly_transcript_11905:205-1164(+)
MKDPLEALQHRWWRRAYLLLVCIVGIVVFQVTVLPRACRIAFAHATLRNARTRNIKYNTHAPRNTLDVYHVRDREPAELCPVVIFCHGGAWNSGDKLHYCTLAKTLQSNGIVVVVINYTLYPKGLVADMQRDITAAITWTKKNIKQHGGEPDKIYFVGHSAGAHLGALVILRNALQGGTKEDITIKGFIGLAGPYDIRDHYEHEFKRGVEHLSPMKNTMGGIKDFHNHSPSALAKTLTEDHLSNLSCTFHILHGDMDATVPHSSSTKFAEALRKAGAKAFMYEYKGLGHSHVLFDLMDNTKTSPVLRDVVKIVNQAKYS